MLKAETAENTYSAFQKERSTSTPWQHGTPSIFPAYPVSALELQHNTRWCGFMALRPDSVLKKILFRGLTLWREPNYLKKTVQINPGQMNIKGYLPLCLVCVRTIKELPTYQHSWGYYCKDKSARSVIGHTVLAASFRMDWLDTCNTIGRILLTKLPSGEWLTLPYVSYYE